MMRIIPVLCLALGLSGAASAAPSPGGLDTSKPIAVNADSVTADLKAETVTYTGNVIVIQGDVKLRADTVTVDAPDGKAARMEARGHVIVNSSSGTAVGDTATYDVGRQVVHLVGQVALTKDNNVMRGTALDVDIATGKVRLTGSAASTGKTPAEGQGGRVQGLFVPAPNKSAPNKVP